MGTRHSQVVINKAGKKIIRQYGQWDGYPDGQGVGILNYLKNGNLDTYQKELDKIPEITNKQLNALPDENWKDLHPYLSRDCGCEIHQMIEDGVVKFVKHISKKEAEMWCEGFYTIDFQKGVFITEWHGKKVEFKLNKLPSKKKYLKAFKD